MNKTFQALSDPTRRKILQMLQIEDLTAGDIAKAFRMTKPSVSHHLNILKNAELVTAKREGQYLIYSLNSTVIQEFIQELMTIFKVGENHENAES